MKLEFIQSVNSFQTLRAFPCASSSSSLHSLTSPPLHSFILSLLLQDGQRGAAASAAGRGALRGGLHMEDGSVGRVEELTDTHTRTHGFNTHSRTCTRAPHTHTHTEMKHPCQWTQENPELRLFVFPRLFLCLSVSLSCLSVWLSCLSVCTVPFTQHPNMRRAAAEEKTPRDKDGSLSVKLFSFLRFPPLEELTEVTPPGPVIG